MPSIECRNVTVEFPIYDARSRSLRHTLALDWMAKPLRRSNVGGLIEADRRGRVVIKALKDVSFDLKRGDRVGLLGHNGSGKTTLLRLLSGIYEPTGGALTVAGRVTPLFDLQIGMDPDQSGLENIVLRGRMLGLTNRQIEANVRDVAEFTELGDYLYMPIRTYSAGMLIRLSFAVSTAISPDILLLDEMIGAGDAAFLQSAHRRLQHFLHQAGIVVLASHNQEMLRHWCDKALLLHHGMLVMYGPIEEAIARYTQVIAEEASGNAEPAAAR